MALTFEYAITAIQADCSSNTLTDNTVYGLGEAERHTRAHYVIASKNAIDGTPTYLIMDNTSPTNVTGQADPNDYVADEIVFPTAMDGWYQFFILSVSYYDNTAAAYTPETLVEDVGQNDQSVVWNDTDSTFYYCVQTNGTGTSVVEPQNDDGSYWVPLDLDNMETEFVPLVDNASLVTHEHNDIVTCYGENCLVRLLELAVDEGLCKDCNEFFKMQDYSKIDVLINGANAKNYEDKQAEAEEILRVVEDFCAKC